MDETQGNNPKAERNRFTLEKFAKIITWRQKKKNANTRILIWGAPRTGKTNLGFRILMKYLHEKRIDFAKGESAWNPPNKWSENFKKFFAGSAAEMDEKLKHNPEESYVFIDEGNDIVSWTTQLETEQRELTQLSLKIGKKKILDITIIPSMTLIQKEYLSLAHYLFIIPHEPKDGKNEAYLLRNYEHPVLREKCPFGLKTIIKDVEKNEWLADLDAFLSYIRRKTPYVCKFTFRPIDSKIYALYDKMVKEPIIQKSREKRKTVTLAAFVNMEYAFSTLLFNLVVHDGKKIAQIETLLRDKFGTALTNRAKIKSLIDRETMRSVTPTFSAKDTLLEDEPPATVESEDVDVEESSAHL